MSSLKNRRSSVSLSRESAVSSLSTSTTNNGRGMEGHKQKLEKRRTVSNNDKNSTEKKLEKQFKRMSHIFYRSKTDDGRIGGTKPPNDQSNGKFEDSIAKLNSGVNFDLDYLGDADADNDGYNGNDGLSLGEIPPPRSANGSFYSLRNDSSGTLIGRQRSLDTQLPTMTAYSNSVTNLGGINNVEFTNIRNDQGHAVTGGNVMTSPTSGSMLEKTRESKIGRFLGMTGHKVKKTSDINGEVMNLGLGLQGTSDQGQDSLSILPMIPKGMQGKDLKSPISRSFGKIGGEQQQPKLSFSEKLKMLNSTKYKNYHYHNLLRNKKESLKNGMKLGSKNGDAGSGLLPNGGILAGTSIALSDINYQEIDMMIDCGVLNFEQCEQYCAFLLGRIQNLLLSLFRGESLKCPMEDVTKLVSLYVRLRKVQENVSRKEAEHIQMGVGGSGGGSIMTPSSISASISTSALQEDDGRFNDFETPFMKPASIFGNSPSSSTALEDMGSPSAFSPLMKVGAVGIGGMIFNASAKVREEINDILRQGLAIMVGQMYYEESSGEVRFMKGGNHYMSGKRKNTVNSFGEVVPPSSSSSSIFPSKTAAAAGAAAAAVVDDGEDVHSFADISSLKAGGDFPQLTPTHTNMWDGGIGIVESAFNNEGWTSNAVIIGGFDKCTALLWNTFQRYVMYEMNSILLPVELEFASGHMEASRIHSRANSILYNHGEKLRSFTNTMVHPDILRYDTSGSTAGTTGTVGTLGEWTDVNVRSMLLVAFRDHVVIPLYEATRTEDDEQPGTPGMPTHAPSTSPAAAVAAYMDAHAVSQCLAAVAGVATLDTNHKLVEHLLGGR